MSPQVTEGEGGRVARLPIEIETRGSWFIGGLLVGVGGICGGLLLFACVADGLSRGFGATWWMLLLAAPFGWMLYHGLGALRARAHFTITAEEVHARQRRFWAWTEWREATRAYRAIRVEVVALEAADGTATGITRYEVWLAHEEDARRVLLRDAPRDEAIAYCRGVAGALGLPTEGCE